jgi:hypothetical protein
MTEHEQKLVEAARAMLDIIESNAVYDGDAVAEMLRKALAPYQPEKIDIGGVRVNAGMREAPEDGSNYFYPDFSGEPGCYHFRWNGLAADLARLRNGMCCRTAKDAIAMHDAIVRLTGVAG